jgi:hypothetical protein
LSYRFIERWILPVLDGFDEMRKDVRPIALSNLAVCFRRRPVILTSRTTQFTQIKWAAASFLPGSIKVHMRPVAAEDALKYLSLAAPQADASAWNEIFDHPSVETAEILASPLMIWLLADICSTSDVDPRTMLAPSEAGSVRPRLLESLVPAAFSRIQSTHHRDRGHKRSTVSPSEAVDAFSWLASHLESFRVTSISWWQIEYFVPLLGITLGLATTAGLAWGLLAGKTMIWIIPPVALVLGAFFGFGCGRGYSNARKKGMGDSGRSAYGGSTVGADPELRPHLYRLGTALLGTAVFTAIAQITARLTPITLLAQHINPINNAEESRIAVIAGIASALTCITAIAIGSLIGWYLRSNKNRDAQLAGARAGTPRESMQRDGRNALIVSIPGVLTCGCAMFAVFYQFPPPERLLAAATALISVVPGSFVQTAWPRYRIAHLWLALLGLVPLPFMTFLEEAHGVGILRQTGLSYEFRHDLLRESLINRRRVGIQHINR